MNKIKLLAASIFIPYAHAKTCVADHDCTPAWQVYACECANARERFMEPMNKQHVHCWTGAGVGVGCANECGGNCPSGGHIWEGSCWLLFLLYTIKISLSSLGGYSWQSVLVIKLT